MHAPARDHDRTTERHTDLRGGARPISIDLSARYHGNGEAKYLRKGDIIDHPDGSISFTPNHSETNLWTFQLGVSMGAGGRR